MRRRGVYGLVALLLSCSANAFAHGLDCLAGTLEFEESILHNWRLSDALGGSIVWTDSLTCGEQGNFTGGTGNAACISGSGYPGVQSIDTALLSYDFYIGCKASVYLTFQLNFQPSSPTMFLDVDVSADNEKSWTTLVSWNTSKGIFRASVGEQVVVDLSSLSTPGLLPRYVRFRLHDTSVSGDNWYAQIDNVGLNCVAAPTADSKVRIDAPTGPLVTGVAQRISLISENLGPDAALNVVSSIQFPESFSVLGFLPNDGGIVLNGNTLTQSISQIPAGSSVVTFVDILPVLDPSHLSMATENISAITSNSLCEIRFNNNVASKSLSIVDSPSNISPGGGTPDPFDKIKNGNKPRLVKSIVRHIRLLKKIELRPSAQSRQRIKKLRTSIREMIQRLNQAKVLSEELPPDVKLRYVLKLLT